MLLTFYRYVFHNKVKTQFQISFLFVPSTNTMHFEDGNILTMFVKDK